MDNMPQTPQQPQTPQGPPAPQGPQGPQPEHSGIQQPMQEPAMSIPAILSLVFSLVFWPAGLILGFIGISDTKNGQKRGRGLAIAGTLISGFFAVMLLLFIVLAIAFADEIEELEQEANNPQASIVEDSEEDLGDTSDAVANEAEDIVPSPTTPEEPRNIEALARDAERQTDLNALLTQLEVFFNENGYYPLASEITTTTLPGIDQRALESPNGNTWSPGTTSATNPYTYNPAPAGCDNTVTDCTSYVLGAWLEDSNEAYTKNSLN